MGQRAPSHGHSRDEEEMRFANALVLVALTTTWAGTFILGRHYERSLTHELRMTQAQIDGPNEGVVVAWSTWEDWTGKPIGGQCERIRITPLGAETWIPMDGSTSDWVERQLIRIEDALRQKSRSRGKDDEKR